MHWKTSTRLAALGAVSLALTACTTSGGGGAGAGPETETFAIATVTVSPMAMANLCSQLGGQGERPRIVITHTAQAGVPIRVRMYDDLSDGSTFNHGSTRMRSDASGRTTVDYAFRPPCNTTGGRRNSTYRFDVTAGDSSRTVTWGRYNSRTRRIQ